MDFTFFYLFHKSSLKSIWDEFIWNIGKFENLQCIEYNYIHEFTLILKKGGGGGGEG